MNVRPAAVWLSIVACGVGFAWSAGAGRPLHAQGTEPRKRALLVGISTYARSDLNGRPGYGDLHGENDLEAVRDVLVRRFGFAPGDITLLRSQDATKTGIERAFREKLIAPTQPGDIVYFQFSGHGSQVPDQRNGDETMDHKDETLVPFDYVSREDHANDILDDEIHAWVRDLAARKPGNATLVFDCCHSGSITRGPWLVRGGSSSPYGTSRQGMFDSEDTPDNVVVISACRNDQSAYERPGADTGLLTFGLTRALERCDRLTTYADLIDRIEATMLEQTDDQSPQLEGNAQLAVLGCTAIPAEPHYTVQVRPGEDPTVSAGLIHGADEGTQFALYPAGTKAFDGVTPFATAHVGAASLTHSSLEFDGERPRDEDLQAACARMTGRRFGGSGVRLCLDGIPDAEAGQVRAFPLVASIVPAGGPWDLRLSSRRARRGQSVYRLERPDGTLVGESGKFPEMEVAIQREACRKMLRALSNQDPTGAVRVEVRPVRVQAKLDGRNRLISFPVLSAMPARNGRMTLRLGEFFMLEARNTGSCPAHVTVLDIPADGSVGPMYPYPDPKRPSPVTYRNNIVEPDGEWKLLGSEYQEIGEVPWFLFQACEPVGVDTVKVIATTDPLDFSPLLDRRFAVSVRGADTSTAADTPLGQLLKAATLGTRAKPTDLSPEDWATSEAVFEVVRR